MRSSMRAGQNDHTDGTTHSDHHTAGGASHAGEGVGNTIKKGLVAFHGAGETIRGNFNTLVDGATFTDKPDSKNHAIAERGVEEMETGRYQHGGGAGVTPADTPRERAHREANGESEPAPDRSASLAAAQASHPKA